jgi:Tfp pilus assembly protein PilF
MEKEFHSRPAIQSTVHDEQSFRRRRAIELCEEALETQRSGNVQKAITIYKNSLKILPTAEAHCFYGWALSQLGRLDLAIQECHKAIRLNPGFGNSYNDIGSYHVRKGLWRDAIHWFERAKKIPDYESPHFPFINLGRLYAAQGSSFRALREFKQALKFAPSDQQLKDAIQKIEREITRGSVRSI